MENKYESYDCLGCYSSERISSGMQEKDVKSSYAFKKSITSSAKVRSKKEILKKDY